MKKNILKLALLVISTTAYSQVGIGTSSPDPSSILELNASDKGLLLPRVALTDVTLAAPLASHVQGMVVYNTATSITGYVGNAEGIWRNDGTEWRKGLGVGTSSGDWSLTGNAGTTPGTNFLGTTDAQDLVFKANNNPAGYISIVKENTSLGYKSNANSGTGNVAIGVRALATNTNGSNVAVGNDALEASGNSKYNVAVGHQALKQSAGSGNTALGALAGDNVTTGSGNIIIGGAQDTPTPTTDNFLNIGGAIFGTGLLGTAGAPAGNIGIGKVAPAEKLDVAGSFHNQTVLGSGNHTGIYSGTNTIGGGYQSTSIYNMPNATIGAGEQLKYVTVQDSFVGMGITDDVTGITGKTAHSNVYTDGSSETRVTNEDLDNFASFRLRTEDNASGSRTYWNSVEAPSGVNNSTTIDFSAQNPVRFVFSNGGTYDEYSFPRTDGTANQVLTTNGSGTLSWQNAGGGAALVLYDENPVAATPASATGTNSVAIGDATVVANDLSAAVGKNNNLPSGHARPTHAFGYGNTVAAAWAFAAGSNNSVSGSTSHAFGYNNTISSAKTYVVGEQITASQANTIILGSNTVPLNVGVGTTTPFTKLQITSENVGGSRGVAILQHDNDPTNASRIVLAKSRGTEAAQTAVLANDAIGRVTFNAHNGTTYNGAAAIQAGTTADHTATNASAYIDFITTPVGSILSLTRMRISEDGNIGIGTTLPTSKLHVNGLPGFATDAAAGVAGLTAGAFYQTSGHATLPNGVVMVKQ